ncbi:MAG: hypothetical protein GY822_06105 [Deltaproteobacteria bacterium]|nr:hypothetical protein [Deltaproteobacteria bacterium]
MAKRALIAEPDLDEARKQAAILTEAGYDVSIFAEGDLIRELHNNTPDVVILRHERRGQSGLALVGRLKRQGTVSATSVVLSTSDLTKDAIEKHQNQKFCADTYIRLPVSRVELLTAAASVPEVLEVDDVAEVEGIPEPPMTLLDGFAPPPGTGAFAALPNTIPTTPGMMNDAMGLSEADLSFVEGVFDNIEGDGEPVKAAPRKVASGLSGPDRKVALLQESLRQREAEIAKLKGMWNSRSQQYEVAEEAFGQKDVEVAGLRLKIDELKQEVEEAHLDTERRTLDFGKSIGEQYENHSLEEVQLIQEVASKEDQLNRQRRKLRKVEEEKEQNETVLKQHIFDWEKAYKSYEEHHQSLMAASFVDVARLEKQIHHREMRVRQLKGRLKKTEESLARSQVNGARHEKRSRLKDLERHENEQRILIEADALLIREKHLRIELENDVSEMSATLFETEERLYHTDRLLPYLGRQRRKALHQLANLNEEKEADQQRHLVERRALTEERDKLQAVLSEERIYGEAALAHLFEKYERLQVIERTQRRHRDKTLDRLYANKTDLEQLLEKAETARDKFSAELEQNEDWVRDLDKTVTAQRQEAGEAEERLKRELAEVRHLQEVTSHQLMEVQINLDHSKEELGDEKRHREQEREDGERNLEHRGQELKDRQQRVQELERDVGDAREDLNALRLTVSTRDDRISELLSRVRDVDGENVTLEGQNIRLQTSVSEQHAELEVNREQLAKLKEKVVEKETEHEAQTQKLTANTKVRRELEGSVTSLEEQLGAQQREAELLKQRGADIAANVKEKEEALKALDEAKRVVENQLSEARAELAVQATVTSEIEESARLAEERAQSLRTLVNELEVEVATAKESSGQQETSDDEKSARIEEQARALVEISQALKLSEEQCTALQNAQQETDKNAQENARLSSTLDDAQRRLEAEQQVRQGLEKKLVGVEQALEAEKEERAKGPSNDDVERLQTLIQAREQEVASARADIEKARAETAKGKSDAEGADNAKVARLQILLKQRGEELRKTQERAHAAEQEKVVFENVQGESEALLQKCSLLEQQLNVKTKDAAAATGRVKELEENLSSLKSSADDIAIEQKKHRETQETLQQAQLQLSRLSSAHDGVHAKMRMLEEQLEQLKKKAVSTSPSPVLTSPSPVLTSPSPVLTSPSPVLTSPSPVLTSPNPVLTSPSPAMTSPSPATSAPNPAVLTPVNPPTEEADKTALMPNPFMTQGSPKE